MPGLDDVFKERIARAGLEFHGFDGDPGLPSVAAVWSEVACADVSAAIVIADHDVMRVSEVWFRCARERGLLTPSGEFLLSLGGLGALPWGRVRWPHSRDLSGLKNAHDQLEFVAMNLDGTDVCGVTDEEHGIWIVCYAIGCEPSRAHRTP